MPVHGVFVLESHHSADFVMEASAHDFLEVFLVIGGRGSFVIDGDESTCEAGDVVVVPAGCRHQILDEPTLPLSLYGVCLASSWVSMETTGLRAGSVAIPDKLGPRLRTELRRMLFDQTNPRDGWRWLLVGRALQFLGLVQRCQMAEVSVAAAGRGGDASQRMAAYVVELEHRFYEAMELDAEADSLQLSRRRFTQLFRQETGTSWLDHVMHLRVEYAKRLLRESKRSVSAIAFESGFEELSGFYRAFKRRVGMAPLDWRNSDEA